MLPTLAFVLRRREIHKKRKTEVRSAPTPAQTPIPAFAAVGKNKPVEVDEEG